MALRYYMMWRGVHTNAPVERGQWWRRFHFCLQPIRLVVVAKYSILSLPIISLPLAFAAKYCFRCKVNIAFAASLNPAIRQTFTAGSTGPTMTFHS